MGRKSKFQAKIEALGVKTEHFCAFAPQKRVSFEVHQELDFTVCRQISKVLGTDKIKLGSGYSDGGCESCGFGNEWWITVEATEVTGW